MINNRQQQQQGRRRGRGRTPQNNGGRNENSSRIDNRSRGNAPQMLEKYKNMARDAQSQGDRVMTEYYLQFADHYFRIVAEGKARFEEQRRQRDDWQEDGDNSGYAEEQTTDGYDGDNGNGSEDESRPREEQPRNNRDNRESRNGRDNRGGRDNNRDNGGRENTGRDNGRENGGRETSSRDNGSRDNNGRDSTTRDSSNRDTGPREPNPRRERTPRRPVERENSRNVELDDDAPAMLDASILPPAFASDASVMAIDIEPDAAPAPKRRGRPKRVEVVEESSDAAE